MAIQPPSDIVSDVINAADPAAVEVAQAKLRAGQAASQAQRLSGTDQSFEVALNKDVASRDALNSLKADHQKVTKKHIPEAYRKFEGMVLQSMLKNMMPDSDEIYGKGATGEIWKGMMAEQLGNFIAKNGGIGIADTLTEGGITKLRDPAAVSEKNRGDRMHTATQLIEENQMKALGDLLPGDRTEKSEKTV